MEPDSSPQQSLFLKVTFTVCVPPDSTGDIHTKRGGERGICKISMPHVGREESRSIFQHSISVLSKTFCATQLETKGPISAHPTDTVCMAAEVVS